MYFFFFFRSSTSDIRSWEKMRDPRNTMYTYIIKNDEDDGNDKDNDNDGRYRRAKGGGNYS